MPPRGPGVRSSSRRAGGRPADPARELSFRIPGTPPCPGAAWRRGSAGQCQRKAMPRRPAGR
eukprot:2414051-Lingulodinium_polyedra.AAC.1